MVPGERLLDSWERGVGEGALLVELMAVGGEPRRVESRSTSTRPSDVMTIQGRDINHLTPSLFSFLAFVDRYVLGLTMLFFLHPFHCASPVQPIASSDLSNPLRPPPSTSCVSARCERTMAPSLFLLL